jgi:hypothetical protein
MFQTFDSAKLPFFWKEEGESVWSYAELLVNAAWFYVDCRLTDGVDTVTSTYLLSKSSQIIELTNKPELTINSVYIVSPPYLNKTSSWQMNTLTKISIGKIKRDEYESDIELYEFKNGEKLYSCSDVNSGELIENFKIIYS